MMEEYLSRNRKRRGRLKEEEMERRIGEAEREAADTRERMFVLREENRQLLAETERYRDNEKYVTLLLLNAQKAAEKIVADGEAQAAKRMWTAQEQERRLRETIESYCRQLRELESTAAELHAQITQTVAEVGDAKQKTVRELPDGSEQSCVA